ncbi:hypothetical protein [Agromyces sp. NPDC058104]|uniref:hypothetical protein n=1 Tax=Agromyces sp. NPDC058104 TaxID=3346342 RepID=UPI0036DD5F15
MPAELLVSKVANALIEDVKVNVRTPVLGWFRSAWGGLWVGGRVTLTTEAVSFAANGLNRIAQSGTLDVTIPLAEITGVEVLPGFITRIVAITTPDVTLKVRCYGAARFAEEVLAARGRLG